MKTAMILGAAGGIGRAVLKLLGESDFQVIAVARDTSSLNGRGTILLEADLANPADAQRVALEAGQSVETVDLWVYAAGDILAGRNGNMPLADWRRVFDANIVGAHLSLNACLPILSPQAHLFFIGAYVDRLIVPGLSAYAASKAALETYTAVLEKELRGKRVTLVRPAAVKTDFWKKVPFNMPSSAIPPEDVARRILTAYEQGLSGLLDL